MRFAFKAKPLALCFNLKDTIEHNTVHEIQCPNCDHSYIGETGRRVQERLKDHAGRDKNSHILKDWTQRDKTIDDLKIVNNSYRTY